MTPKQFEAERARDWQRLESILDALEKGRKRQRLKPVDADRLPSLYRQACADLALAEHRMYGMRLCDRLHGLVQRAYRLLYRRRALRPRVFIEYLAETFPRAVRRNIGLFWLCTLSFAVPCVALAWGAQSDPVWVQSVLGPEGMANFEQMYGRDADVASLRPDGASDVAMFGFYIYNNVSIDFRTFAGGILGGIGTLLILLVNGVAFGAGAGWVHLYGSPEHFYSFVIGHSGPELLGMLIAGMAGMKLGLALLRPGPMTRSAALRRAAVEGMELLYGAALLTVGAAFIEGFWSAQDVTPSAKYAVGAMIWLMLVVYLTFGGRRLAA